MAFKTTRRGLLAGSAGAVTVAGAGLAGCSSARIIGFNPAEASLDIANAGEPLSMDPHKATGTWENNLVGNLFMGLTTEDEFADAVPGMALRWETAADGLSWTFFLRDAVWSDGVPVTAYDFEFALRRIMNPESLAQYASVLYAIKNAEAINSGEQEDLTTLGVTAIDDKTLRIDLEHPAPYLLGLLRHYTAYPLPRHKFEPDYAKFPIPQGLVPGQGARWIKPQNVVTNGAYLLKQWISNYIVTFEKNPLFWDADNVQFKKLYFYPTTDANVQARGVASGERGWATNFPSNQVRDLRARLAPGSVRVAPYLLTQYTSFNTTRAPFNDVRVRQALTMAVNREFIATQIYKTEPLPAYRNVPYGIEAYPGKGEPGPRYTWAEQPLAERQAQARRLLEAAGYGPNNPLTFEFKHRNSGDNPRVAVVLQSDWRAIAPWVTVELVGTEVQVHYASLRAKDFVAGDGGWVADFNDAKNYLFLHETRTGEQNYSGFSNPIYDQLMRDADNERDAIRRMEIMMQAEQIVLDECPICPTVFDTSRNLIDPRIQGYSDNIEDIHRARWFKFDPV
jgi:oligopeptide transport system substrate-binding protein